MYSKYVFMSEETSKIFHMNSESSYINHYGVSSSAVFNCKGPKLWEMYYYCC